MTEQQFRTLIEEMIKDYNEAPQHRKEQHKWTTYGYACGLIEAIKDPAKSDKFAEIWDNEYREKVGF